MSYLLRNQHRLSSKPGGLGSMHSNNKAPSSLQRSSLGMQHRTPSTLVTPGGSGQIQIQRQHHAPPPSQQQQQQQQRVQGVISMEEVMADLRILEAQQQESERQLQHAKVTKQRRLDYQTALEEKLDKCKYANGQISTELQRSQELLSDGHRQLNEARKASIKAGNDLRDYDSKVNNAIRVKASIFAHQRTQGGWLSKLQEKVVMIDDVLCKAKLQFQVAKTELEQAEQFEHTLRSDIKNESDIQQRIVDQTSKLSSEITAYERKFETLSSLQEHLKKQIHILEKEEIVILDSQRAKLVATLNSLQAEQFKLRDEFATEQDELKAQIKKKNDDLHGLWHEMVALQKSEGHAPSPLPSESDSLPVLDIDRIRQTLQIEIDAVTSEQKAKDEIDESIQELSTQLSELQFRHKNNVTQIAELQASNTQAVQGEESRRASNTLFLERYDKIRMDVDEKEKMARALHLEHNREMDVLNKELEILVGETNHMKKSYATYTNKNRDVDDEILSIQLNHDKLKGANEAKMSNMQVELEHVRSSIIALQKETNSTKVLKHRSTERTDISLGEQKRRRRRIDEANQRIASILKQYPELNQLHFNYRPDLSDHEQAFVDLKKFTQKCKARDRITEANIAEWENSKKLGPKHDHVRPEVGGKRLKEHSTHHVRPEVGGKRLKEHSTHNEILKQESTSKPRALLTTFVRASQGVDKENEYDGCTNKGEYASSKNSTAKKSRTSHRPDDWTHHSEKKVRWQQDNAKLEDIKKPKGPESKKHTETAFSSLQKSKGSVIRQSFGSSDKPKASDTRAKYGSKDTNEGKEKVMMPDSRSSISNPLLSNTKLSSTNKHVPSALKGPSVSNDSKKRTSSSRQSSGISSQERSSKLGRRRKRSSQSGGASVGSKSAGRRGLDDDEYNFNFTKL